MKKKDLMDMQPREPSEEMIRRAKKDRCCERKFLAEHYVNSYTQGWKKEKYWDKKKEYGTRLFLTARKERGILTIGVFTRERLKAGNLEPFLITWIDLENEKWLSLIEGERWSEAGFDRITWSCDKELTGGVDWRIAEDVFEEKDLRLVKKELKTKADDIGYAIELWQRNVREEATIQRARRRADHWERQMYKIPKEPEDFDDWIQHEATRRSNFIFYKTVGKKKECYCSHCEYTWKTGDTITHNPGDPTAYMHKVEHNAFCPNCHTFLETKAWKKQERLRTEDRVTLMQRTDEYAIFRGYKVEKQFWRENGVFGEDWKCFTIVSEDIRVLANMFTFRPVESYTIREDRTLGKTMWAETKKETSAGRQPLVAYRGIPYTKNMAEVLDGSYVRPAVLKLFMSGSSEFIQSSLITAARKRYVEYIVRSGLMNLAEQVIKYDVSKDIVDPDAHSLKDLLGLDGQQLHSLKEVNGNTYAIRALRYAKEHGEKLPTETLRTITRHSIDVERINLKRTGMTVQRMVNYMMRQARELNKSFHETVRLYSDYLDMAWKLGADLKDEIICHTSKLKEMHDRYAREKNANIDKYNAQSADKKFTKISEKYEENTEHFKYSKAGLTILVPTCASDIQFEGKRQHHCVGASDRYLIRMNEGESFILFLRKEEAKEEPYYTLEVEYDGKIRQSYGAYDRKPDWNKVEPVLIGFTRAIGKRTQRERQMAAGQEV